EPTSSVGTSAAADGGRGGGSGDPGIAVDGNGDVQWALAERPDPVSPAGEEHCAGDDQPDGPGAPIPARGWTPGRLEHRRGDRRRVRHRGPEPGVELRTVR